MAQNLVIVAGNLGVGKTALVEQVGARLDWHIMREPVIDNPYLTDFYADMHAWSFHLQIYFLGHRAKQHLESIAMHRPVLMDRGVYECGNVFAPALHRMGHINERDYAAYLQMFDVMVRTLPPPSLLIYLKAPLKVLVQRIERRGLEFDYRGVSEDYLALIDSFYMKWVRAFDLCPILTIDTENFDYVSDKRCLEIVIERILHKLSKGEEARYV